ncbi:tetratricopeptide repeat protein [Sphingomonas flavalba]|uniref:tetratricopeptide repeat protein n=1 Tax=Sphingomonas flavalba TaxID=2559804 RepID=UPI00109D9964|nr:tetratricopeptide repeat protein [Sphingomonas flavalba]
MLDQVPTQGWLLLLIALFASAPAQYVYQYLARAPARRDITQPPEDLSWRTRRLFVRSAAILLVLAALAVFIFTPAAAQFARGPLFWPIMLTAFGVFGLGTVARGFSTGRIEPFTRGIMLSFKRRSQPKRFWASMAWNTLLSCGALWAAIDLGGLAKTQALERQCRDPTSALHPQDAISACSQLVEAASEDDGDLPDLIANRGWAYFRAGDYRRAKADYARAVHLSPDDPNLRFNLGLIDERANDMAGAIAQFGEAIQLRPDDAGAYSRRGVLLLEGGHFDRAIADFTRAHELQPTDPWPLARRADAYDQMGERAKMEADDDAVIRLSEAEERTRR